MKNEIHFSRKLLLAAFVLISIFLIVGIPNIYSQEKNPDPCTLGDLYLQAGQLDKAEETYAAILTNNPQEVCAIEGMQEITKQRKALLQTYMEAGDYEKAKELVVMLLVLDQDVIDNYHTILTQEAMTPEVTNTPLPTLTPTPLDYKVAETYLEIGRSDLAYEKLQTAIVANPNLSNIEIFNKKMYFWSSYWLGWIRSNIFYILFGLAIAIIVINYFKNKKPKFDIGDFCTGEEKDNKLANKVKVLVEREVIRYFTTNNTSYQLLDQPQQIGEVSLDVSVFSPILTKDVVSFFSQVIRKVFPPKLITLSGTLVESKQKGKGIVLRLVNSRGSLVSEITMWQSIYDPEFTKVKANEKDEKTEEKKEVNDCLVDDYLYLIKPAALWIFWHIVNNYHHNTEKNENKLLAAFGTKELFSSLDCLVGGDLQNKKYMEKAEGLLVDSLDYDNKNVQALYNFALLEYEKRTKELNTKYKNELGKNKKNDDEDHIINSYDEVIKKFVGVIKIYKEDKEGKIYPYGFEKENPFIYSYYYLGAIYWYLYIFLNFDKKSVFNNYDLIQSIIDQEKLKKNQEQGYKIIDLCFYFFKEAYSLSKRDGKARKQNRIVLIPKNINKSFQDNLTQIDKKLIEVAYEAVLRLRDYDPEVNPEIPEIEKSEDAFFIGYESGNLACYYSTMAGILWKANINKKQVDFYMKKALSYLNLSDPSELFEEDCWESIDPSLFLLRKWFREKILSEDKQKEFTKPHEFGELGGMSSIYSDQIKKVNGINNCRDLLIAGLKTSGRKYLLKQTSVPSDLLYEWIKQADLMRIPWIDGKFAKLLLLAGVDSIRELRRRNAGALYKKMESTNKEYKIVEKVPKENYLAEWINKAKETELILETD